ncbi:hypothetical protein DPMN_052678 [Dreissena polymorpha]|uniref:Uncharacterized protein n=1 Tax=Dreissena polymorpha TaxID=45954 RepID=A0A9D4CKM1_DREPO|nr:hypothetical protein DPMN_052546 [Dreissena polymorpha]KAH3726808.1 hypothetical protein DPMN_052678 [Dreissena polymorpha]
MNNAFSTLQTIEDKSYLEKKRSLVSVDTLLDLMELHVSLCGYAEFCLTSADVLNEKVQVNCCYKCSCEDICTLKGSCCPDYWFRGYVDFNSTFQNISELRKVLTSIRLHNVLTYEYSLLAKSIKENEQCISERHISDSLVYDPGFSINSYWMAATCPDEAVLTSPNEDSINGMNRFIPVVSNQTGLVYKNKMYLSCNENIDDFESFTIHVIGTMTDNWSGFEFTASIQDLFLLIIAEKLPYFNILYRPPNNFADIPICKQPSVSLPNCNTICDAYPLPVRIRDQQKLVFKTVWNAGCYRCYHDNASEFVRECHRFYPNRPEFILELNLEETGTLETTATLNEFLNITTSVKCPNNYVYDIVDVR